MEKSKAGWILRAALKRRTRRYRRRQVVGFYLTMLLSLLAVSYTHLDVYKRQLPRLHSPGTW